MAALIIPTSTNFGGMTNQAVSRLLSLNTTIARLQEGIATASSGYGGTPGTEFEAAIPVAGSPNMMPGPNNFGIYPDPDTPGAQGQAYAYAVEMLQVEWQKFWTAAQPYIAALDNGTGGGP